MATNKEYSIPKHNLSVEDKKAADKLLSIERFKRLNQLSDASRIYAGLLKLKYEIEDYLTLETFDRGHTFDSYLKKYVQIFNLKRKALAEDLSIHETKFSRIINGKEDPGLNILYRIEGHSNGVLKAELLWKLVMRKMEFEIIANKKDRKIQLKLVRNKFRYDKKDVMNE